MYVHSKCFHSILWKTAVMSAEDLSGRTTLFKCLFSNQCCVHLMQLEVMSENVLKSLGQKERILWVMAVMSAEDLSGIAWPCLVLCSNQCCVDLVCFMQSEVMSENVLESFNQEKPSTCTSLVALAVVVSWTSLSQETRGCWLQNSVQNGYN